MPISERLQPRTRENGAKRRNRRGGTFFHGEIDSSAAEKARTGLPHAAVVCPNVTGRTKDMIAQSKRARAGSLAIIVD